jgi:hypothetical protein
MDEPVPEGFQLSLTWIDVDKVPIQFINSMLTQLDELGEIILTFGQATPPVLTGTTAEENRKQLERIAYVPVRPVARFAVSRSRLEQFLGFLSTALVQQDQYLAARRKMEKGGNP